MSNSEYLIHFEARYRPPLETQDPSDLAHAAVENSLFMVSTSAIC